MPDVDLATILANGDYLKREGGQLVGVPGGGPRSVDLPWGVLAQKTGAGDQVVTTTEAPLLSNALNSQVTVDVSRYVRAGLNLTCTSTVGGGSPITIRLYIDGVQRYIWTQFVTGTEMPSLDSPVLTAPSGLIMFAWTAQAPAGNVNIPASSYQNAYSYVEDCGPT